MEQDLMSKRLKQLLGEVEKDNSDFNKKGTKILGDFDRDFKELAEEEEAFFDDLNNLVDNGGIELEKISNEINNNQNIEGQN